MSATATVPANAHGVLDRALGPEWRNGAADAVEDASNLVLRLQLGEHAFAVRMPRLEAAVTQVDRRSECIAIKLAAHHALAPQVAACDFESGVLVTHWIAGEVWTLQRARESDAIVSTARLLKELHGLAVPLGVRRIELASTIDGYLERIRGSESELGLWCLRHREAALQRLADLPRAAEVLCHCDVHHRNLIEGTSLVLLDWEYAGRIDALFDLASYASYHELDADATRVLLESYGVDDLTSQGFGGWRWLFEYVWLLWLLATAGPVARSGTTAQMRRLVGQLLARE